MKLRQSILLVTLTSFAITLTGCGGGGGSTPPPATVTVTLSGQPASLSPGAMASITATVSNGAGVTWTATCATSPCGSFSSTSTASGTATTYTAPSAPTSVTIAATTASGATSSATITITAPAITVAFSPAPPPTLTTGTTASLTAVVTNDSQNKGVTWTVTCATSPCGSFSSTSTASGTATTYTAPSAVESVTVTATSVTDTTKTAVATINITTPALSVTFNPAPPTSLIVGSTASLTAIVSNDSQNKGVTWTAACSISPCGSFSSASTASGTATVYTAPATVPSPNTVTVTATSVTDTTKSASATITVTPVLANGTYVLHSSGWDSTGPAFLAGAFSVAGGVITGGEVDFTDAVGTFIQDPLVPANCSLSSAGNNIQVVLGTSPTPAGIPPLGVNGIVTLRGAPVSSSRVLISEFDTFAAATGSIDLQTTPVAAPSGGYAFVVSGWDINNSTSPSTVTPLAFGGILNFTGTALSIGNSVFDYNLGAYGTTNGPAIGLAQLFSSGTVNGPDSFGRVSISLVPTTSSTVPSFILTGYIVSPGQIQLVESQNDMLLDDLGGVALGQAANAQFSLSSLAGTTYVFASSGQDVAGLATFGGNLTFSSSGGISGTLAVNDLTPGDLAAGTSITAGSYVVDATGRATLSTITTSQFAPATFAFQLYLDGNGNALHMGADINEVTTGPAYLKTAAATNDFEGPYALSGSGILNDTNLDAWGAVGPVTLTSDKLTGTADYNAQGTTPVSATPVTATENSTNASTLTVTGLDSTAFTTGRLYTYFPIDGKRVFAIETDGAQLGILALESTSH